MLNPLASKLNQIISRGNPHVLEMLSGLGKSLYFPKGIISQTKEAKQKAHRFNATIGIALENGRPMHLPLIQETLSSYDRKDLYPYAPPEGKPELRVAWKEWLLQQNPSLRGKKIGTPIVTNALTHGLSIVADLFVDEGDPLILPDKFWGNYRLTFALRRGAEIVNYPLYTADRRFNWMGLARAIDEQAHRGKAIVLLNFPNNPTGFTPAEKDADRAVEAIVKAAERGMNLVVVTDDAYFGLFYEDSLKESIFSRLAGAHPRIMAIKVDGATKEQFVWGFRVGFITYSDSDDGVLAALEQKTAGLIRATISNGPHPSQTFVLRALKSPDFERQKEDKAAILAGRAREVKEVLDSGRYDDAWEYYPFNSGYFMCLKLKTVAAEDLRVHMLDKYGVGTIAAGERDLRIAFSCIEEKDIPELFSLLYQGVKDLKGAS